MLDNNALIYYQICRNAYIEDYDSIQSLHGEASYTKAQLDYACAEVAYIREHDALPEWGRIIETFERVGGAYMFVYRDMTRLN